MKDKRKITTIIHWAARISGSMILIFITFFVVAHIFGEEESGNGFRNTKEVIIFLFFPISTVIGLSLALKWEGIGGAITTVGMIGLFILRPDLLKSIFMMIPIIPGILYINYWLMTKKTKKAYKS